jgi:hypothetical protein
VPDGFGIAIAPSRGGAVAGQRWDRPALLPAHSETVGAGCRMLVRPRIQGWPVSSPIRYALLLYA